MPKQRNILQFSVPQNTLDQLETLRREGESINTCAKRLLLEGLSGITTSTPSQKSEQKSEQTEIYFDKILTAINDLKVSPHVEPEEKKVGGSEVDELKQQVKDLEKKVSNLKNRNEDLGDRISEMELSFQNRTTALMDRLSQVEAKVDHDIRSLERDVEDGNAMISHLNDWINHDDGGEELVHLMTPSFELGIINKSDLADLNSDNTHNQIPEMTIAKSDEQILEDGELYPNDPPAVDDSVQNLSPEEEINQDVHSAQSFSETNPLRGWRRTKRLRR